jgi:PAS domain S-box-containing protein
MTSHLIRGSLAAASLLVLSVSTARSDSQPQAGPTRVRIGVEFDSPPLSFLNERGEPDGFAHELLREMESTGDLRFEIHPNYWRYILEQFRLGRLDALADVTITDTRRETMDFSIAHAHIHAITYTRPGSTPVEHTSQLAGRKVAMLVGSITHLDASRHGNWGSTVVLYQSWTEVLESVKRGVCDVALLVHPFVSGEVEDLGLNHPFVQDLVYRFHIAVHRGDRLLLERINQDLAEVEHNGSFDRVYSRWIGPIEPHPIRFSDLRPYYAPFGRVVILLALVFWWQRSINRRLADQAGEMRKLTRIVEQAPLSIVITNLAGEIEYANPHFFAVTGYGPAEVLGRNPRILQSGETPRQVFDEMWRELKAGRSWSGQFRNRRKDGEVFLETAVIAPVFDESGRPTHYVGIKDDITAQKRFEAESAAALERERQVSEMKSRFIAVTSHEFRTPMTVIMSSVELLANHFERLDPSKRADLFARIQASLGRMTQMLDDVLTLNRVQAKGLPLQLAQLDLAALAREVVGEFRIADRDAHRFEVSCAPEPLLARTDATLMRHILSNLVGNAVRYSPAETTVLVRIGPDRDGVRLSIEDRGIGIPEADLHRIFEPFERGSNVGTIGGTGLGLNIARMMTEALDGRIWAEPLEGGGTRFVVTLPREPDDGPDRTQSRSQ